MQAYNRVFELPLFFTVTPPLIRVLLLTGRYHCSLSFPGLFQNSWWRREGVDCGGSDRNRDGEYIVCIVAVGIGSTAVFGSSLGVSSKDPLEMGIPSGSVPESPKNQAAWIP